MAALGEDHQGASARVCGPLSLVPLPFARRGADRLRLILAAQSRLREVHTSPRVKHLLAGRGYLDEAALARDPRRRAGAGAGRGWRALRLDVEIEPISVDVGAGFPARAPAVAGVVAVGVRVPPPSRPTES